MNPSFSIPTQSWSSFKDGLLQEKEIKKAIAETKQLVSVVEDARPGIIEEIAKKTLSFFNDLGNKDKLAWRFADNMVVKQDSKNQVTADSSEALLEAFKSLEVAFGGFKGDLAKEASRQIHEIVDQVALFLEDSKKLRPPIPNEMLKHILKSANSVNEITEKQPVSLLFLHFSKEVLIEKINEEQLNLYNMGFTSLKHVEDYFGEHLKGIQYFSFDGLGDAHLTEILKRLENVKILRSVKYAMTDEVITQLTKLENLRSLYITIDLQSTLTSSGINDLASLPITELVINLNQSRVNEALLASIARIQNLSTLAFFYGSLEESALPQLANLEQLTYLGFFMMSDLSDEAFIQIGKLKNFRVLNLNRE
jgi:hypothetical protein